MPKKRARGAPDTKRKRTNLSRAYTCKNAATSAICFNGAQASQVVTSSFDTLKEIAEAETQTSTTEAAIESAIQDIELVARASPSTTRGVRLGAQVHRQWDAKSDEDEWIDIDDDFEGDFEMLKDILVWGAEDGYVFL